MDSKNVKNPRLADLLLKTYHLAADVQDIPSAEIVSDNVEITLAELGEGAEIIQARFGSEIATISESSGVATLDFTSAVTATDLIEIDFKLEL